MFDVQGKNALITGASSGIGRDIAVLLAARGMNLIIVARRRDRLEELKKEIQEKHDVQVDILTMDLSTPESPRELHTAVTELERPVDILINNAGFGIKDYFIDIDFEKENSMLNLMLNNVVHCTKLFVRDMVKQKRGIVMNVSSVGAFQPTPVYNTYAAAKTFILHFSIALNHELQNTGVQCCVLCPGFTITEFQKVAKDELNASISMPKMTSREVAEIAVKKMLKGKVVIVPGLINRFNSKLSRILPYSTVTSVAAKSIGEPAKHEE